MKLEHAPTLERLAPNGHARCAAALFCSYAFDPDFFERSILPAVLGVTADPEEQAAAFYDEAVAALQEVPVACIVDATMRKAGRKLPYALLEVSGRTFHPKLYLLVYDDFAQVQVGSGNLTRGGFGDNAELFLSRRLSYSIPAEHAVLTQIVSFLDALRSLVRAHATALDDVLEQLRRRLAQGQSSASDLSDLLFLHSEGDKSLLDQYLELIPANSQITRIGVLAPFFERDDDDPDADEVSSVLLRLAGASGSKAAIDLGVLWEDAPVGKAAGDETALAARLDWLWGSLQEVDKRPKLDYFTPTAVTKNLLKYLDGNGDPRQVKLDELADYDEVRWPVAHINAYAPPGLVDALRRRGSELRLWLHPDWRIDDEGRRARRPLHAKLFLITATRRGRATTFVLLGSANASRRALLGTPAMGGNVECCFAFALDDEQTLIDFCPELVYVLPENVILRDRQYPAPETNWALLIESALYDAAMRKLTIAFSDHPLPPLRSWRLGYLDDLLASGDQRPAGLFEQPSFTLSPTSCELWLEVDGTAASIPIAIRDLAQLPAGVAALPLELRELLALMGRRISGERLRTIRVEKGGASADAVLEAIFGEGFGPNDVFRAWWNLVAELVAPGLSAPAFRLRLEGRLGAATVWNAILAAVAAGELTRQEAWFYGAELVVLLDGAQLPDGPDVAPKHALLARFVAELRAQLATLLADERGAAWVRRIRDFYGA